MVQAPNNDTAVEIKTILESQYTDGIDTILSYELDDNDDIIGRFRDGQKIYAFGIREEAIAYKLINQKAIASFLETDDPKDDEVLDFKALASAPKKQKNCVKGIPCKGQCINKDKVCKTTVSGSAAKAADYLEAKVPGTKAPIAPSTPKTSKTPKTPAVAKTDVTQSPISKGLVTTAEERAAFMKDRPESKSRLATAKKATKKIPGAPPPHPEEVMAVQDYTGTTYGAINATLRGNDAAVLAKPLTTAEKTKYLEDARFASAALDALPNYTGTVYRGASLPNDVVDQYVVGKVMAEKAFTSTSLKPDVAENFSGSGDGFKAVNYTISSKKGKAVGSLSAVPKEEEILFKPDTQFKVLSKKTKKGVVHIYLEEV